MATTVTSTFSSGSTPIAIAKYDISDDILTAEGGSSNPQGTPLSSATTSTSQSASNSPHKYLAFLGLLFLPLILGLLFFLHRRRKRAQWKSQYQSDLHEGGFARPPSFRLSLAKFPVVEQELQPQPSPTPSSFKKYSFHSFRPGHERNGSVFAAVHAALRFRSLLRPHHDDPEERASLPRSAGAPEVCPSPMPYAPSELPASIPPVEMGRSEHGEASAPASPIDEETTDPIILEAMKALPYMPAPVVIKKPTTPDRLVLRPISPCPTFQTQASHVSEVSRQQSIQLPSPRRVRMEEEGWEGPKALAKFLEDSDVEG